MIKILLILALGSLNLLSASVIIECDIIGDFPVKKAIFNPDAGSLSVINSAGAKMMDLKNLSVDQEKGYFAIRDNTGLLVMAFKFEEEGGLYIDDVLYEINNCTEQTTIDSLDI